MLLPKNKSRKPFFLHASNNFSFLVSIQCEWIFLYNRLPVVFPLHFHCYPSGACNDDYELHLPNWLLVGIESQELWQTLAVLCKTLRFYSLDFVGKDFDKKNFMGLLCGMFSKITFKAANVTLQHLVLWTQ